ncbi:universal stress protein [Paractinoplanes hotanensis]|uniref:Universal stress protein n=1 Tax=Paractinoplanes hotanensis TaxID=2906497 RepID=A0ABT0Y5B0_9ACTN|nr:universal stress protein [Actinoplanes hotanensis]MCM4081226.1 universal stress protein [Actinoplanes hotanensis]
MSDLDNRRTQQDARADSGDVNRPTRYADALNRYLGAAGYEAIESKRAPAEPPFAATPSTGVVVVGADETPAGYTAVDHAAIEAELRGWNLRIVHVQPRRALSSARDAGALLLERLTDRVHACSPSIAVTSHLVVGSPASLLLSQSTSADLLVVGNRHGAASAAIGLSVADRLAGHHDGVIMVVRMPGRPTGTGFGTRPVVVGVEQPGVITPAALFALQEAGLRGCDLVMLSARHGLAPAGRTETIQGVLVHHRTAATDPASALTGLSHGAAAIVVGRRGFGGHPVTMLGSVSRAMVQHAGCPVFLV